MMNKAYVQNNEWWQGLGALKELALEFVGEGNESIERYLDRGQLIKHILEWP